jgi:N-acetylglucosaminyldiphosphoundecaprenol N-acetyl-beta-D-mannosaminyltransferase
VAIGVGAAFRFLTGQLRRCPACVGRWGFEWFYRFLMEPKKLWRRHFVQLPQFAVRAAMELLGDQKHG